jgi:hypothetical protein
MREGDGGGELLLLQLLLAEHTACGGVPGSLPGDENWLLLLAAPRVAAAVLGQLGGGASPRQLPGSCGFRAGWGLGGCAS